MNGCANTISASWNSATTESILKAIEEVCAALALEPPVIKVPESRSHFIRDTQSEYPMIKECDYIDDNDCYVVAGVGVIAGKTAYERIWDIGYIAVWTYKFEDAEE